MTELMAQRYRKIADIHIIRIYIYFAEERIVHSDDICVAPLMAERYGLGAHIIFGKRDIVLFAELV